MITVLAVATMPSAAAHTDTWEHDHMNTTSGGPSHSWGCISNKYAQACFADYGEWFHAYDNQKDGLSPAIQWGLDHCAGCTLHRQGWIWHLAGADRARLKNKSFGEDMVVRYRVCAGKHRFPATVDRDTCTDWSWRVAG